MCRSFLPKIPKSLEFEEFILGNPDNVSRRISSVKKKIADRCNQELQAIKEN